ncbi:cysteine-rich receptor-like protein kinase 2 [Impatiens glandulifera]|uniref:cysteine-rich receptor-like protein kinase 2 n=1 Tax=Impatiens glandulifera TaxID=253017 RepID=UPI001FB11C99|nr:cysteine-rich receptor-like protein kinase 2 [Impatiens glandulifera]
MRTPVEQFVIFIFIFTILVVLLPNTSEGDARVQTAQIICGNQLENNATIFVPNFVATMENISNQIRRVGYGVAVTGSGGVDTNYGLAQCYGDLSLLDCVLCYAEARTVLPQCYPHNGGRIFLDGCFMRSENYTFFHEYTGKEDRAVCGNKTRQTSAFQLSATQAVNQAVADATNGNGYGRAQVEVSGTLNQSAYVLADCWKSLNSNSCKACLENATHSILGCLPWSEGRAMNTGCFMRYSDVDFLNPVPLNPRTRRGRTVIIVVAAISSLVVLMTVALLGVNIWKRRIIEKKRKGSNDAEKLVKTLHDSDLNFKYSTLEKATESFAESNKLGQGGFGTVYKGVLQDGREIAVKRLFFNNRHRAADFYNEVNIISSAEHKNLVKLLGCSCSGPESLLVYEYLPNKSLDGFIFDSMKAKTFNWEKRFQIIIGTAEGLVYLHENSKARIIHRDIKASNILLDVRFRAKIADFGLARSFQEDKSHISTAIAGTLGYMAPEYLAHGQLTEKADVYSFGVLLLEIVTGKQNNKGNAADYTDSLVTMVWKHFQGGCVEEVIEANLMLKKQKNEAVKSEVLRVVHVGLLCAQEIPTLRPSMSKALQMLVNKDEVLPPPTTPPFTDETTMELNSFSDRQASPHMINPGDPNSSFATVSTVSFHPR